MKLTVLGSTGPFPRPGCACSGYLVTDGDTRVLLDCGNGVLSRLLECISLESLDAVILSHLHWDHCADLGILRYALETGWGKEAPMPVITPFEPSDVYRMLLDHPVYAPIEAQAGSIHRVGSLTIQLFDVKHSICGRSIRLTNREGKSIFYTGDTGMHDALAAHAKEADLLLADICFAEADAEEHPPVHMTLRQASRLAREAKVGALACTHLFGGSELVPIPFDFSPAFVVSEGESYEI